MLGLQSSTISLLTIASALRCSEWQARKTIRSLAKKGCIEIEQTRKGHNVKVFLPSELDIPDARTNEESVDIEIIDFFKQREYLGVLLGREQHRCFYCLCNINEESCELDHVISQLSGGGNGYRNIVAACHQCNTKKQGDNPEDFLRKLFRRSLLSDKEFEERLTALASLQDGSLRPLM